MRPIALVVALYVLAPAASGGLLYDFVTTYKGSRTSEEVRGQVWVEGDAYRAEVTRGAKKTVVISSDADRTATYLDPEKQTYSNRVRSTTAVVSSSLFRWPVPGASVRGTPSVTYQRTGTETVAGQEAAMHVLDVQFNVDSSVRGMSAPGRIRITARIWTAEAYPALPMNNQLRTGYHTVDAAIEKQLLNVRGMVLRHELEVTRTLDGGPPQTERTVTAITRIEPVQVTPDVFQVPETFAYVGPK
jgi:hypothetical protein